MGAGVPVTVHTPYPHHDYHHVTTGADGRYTVSDVAVGPFTITAERVAQGQRADAAGSIDAHGQTLTLDLQLLASSVTLSNFALIDANYMRFDVERDGAQYGAPTIAQGKWASRLSLVVGQSTHPFTGSGPSAATEEDKRETVIRQTLGGVNVTRKAFVPVAGYFIRQLDLFENPSAQPVTRGGGVHVEASATSRTLPSWTRRPATRS